MWHERGGVLLPLHSAEINYVYLRSTGSHWGLVCTPHTYTTMGCQSYTIPSQFSNDGCFLFQWRVGERWNSNGCKASLPKMLILGIDGGSNVGTVFARHQLNDYTFFCIFIQCIFIQVSASLYTTMICPVTYWKLYCQYTFILAITFRSDGRPPI